jgi:allophanate hydrolase subunit 1
LFDIERASPALLAPGDAVRFEPIDAEAFASTKAAVGSGEYQVAGEPIAG